MNKKHTLKPFLFFTIMAVTMIVTSCKKKADPVPDPKPLKTLGLVEYGVGANKRIFIGISGVGTVTPTDPYYSVFDTGSTGLTLDATGLVPASMVTSSGITITGDSVVVNGITIFPKQLIMAYGDAISSTKEYGYLAYANFSIGDANGSIATKRIPFFLYYKIVGTDANGKTITYSAHSNDVFGVGPGTSYASTKIASPISYFDIPEGGTNGFKLATMVSTGFTSNATYNPDLLTIGLVPHDLTSAGFIMHPLTNLGVNSGGYSANIAATITYSGKSIAGNILFDTGTPSITTIEDKTATAIGALPVNTPVTITTNKGFTYSYVTNNASNLTQIQNPNNTQDTRTIFSLDFFVANEYLTDYANHQIGLKNN